MSGWLRLLNLLALSVLAALTGCQPPVVVGMYGPAPVEHDPSVEITDFSYTPSSSIEVGDAISFSGTTSKSVNSWDCAVIVTVGSQENPVPGWASGIVESAIEPASEEGKSTGQDTAWAGQMTWYPEYGLGQDLPVSAHLEWSDGYVTYNVAALPLTVLPAVK